MNISIIGAGNVGLTLGKKWFKHHTVTFVVRDQQKYQEITAENMVVSENLPSMADIYLIAIPGPAVEDYITDHISILRDKIVVDASNNLTNISKGMEYLQERFPRIKFVKAFNTVGYNIMKNPDFGSIQSDGYLSGNPQGVELVKQLVEEVGFDPVVIENMAGATELEALARIWIAKSRSRGREIAFKLMNR